MTTPEKKSRRSLTLEIKIQILDCLAQGATPAVFSRKFGLNDATVRTVKKNEKRIRDSVASGTDLSAKKSSYARDPVIEKMEKRSEPSSSDGIKSFSASAGWFSGFLKRYSLHNVKLRGESASADETAARNYPAELASIIREGGYNAHQVFNADGSGLFWKRIPTRTYLAKIDKSTNRLKAAKERITLLFCANASGDHLFKPLLINRSLRPRALKGMDYDQLPVHWLANQKAWVTQAVFRQWFEEMFIPEAQAYLETKGEEFHAFLIVDNVPGHPPLEYPNVKVIFLPPNTTSLIQPLDQGIIANFKKLYIGRTMRFILEAIEKDPTLTVPEAWKTFTMKECLEQIGAALLDIKPSTLNACWRSLWPECVQSTDVQQVNHTSEIIFLAHVIGGEGFDDMAEEDVCELLQEPVLGDEDLIEMLLTEPEEIADEVSVPELTSEKLEEGFRLAEQKAKTIHAVLAENRSGESSEEELFIGALEALDEGEDWFETVKVNISKVSVKLDTGAHCNVLPLWMVEKLDLLPLKLSPTKWLLTFSNHKMLVLGEVDPVCTVKQKQTRITFKVVEERVIPLLGRKTCIAQNLITRIDSLEIDDVEVYDGLGCLKYMTST
ncbi:tigger transposable element-derived protein 1-like [Uranotaenia lowii]|uniref:tigger transposable element-derived protein 1-like n=1 Tax=Uranotaenia lowii TaxID=190385 RepID=UPI00247A9E1A|nr:tigger transposable element-derived protein 1-like [Uranotaenia lowii]